MGQVDLSVLLPVFDERDNVEALLPRLKRVLARLGCTTEIILVDGGSEDGTADVARTHGARIVRQSLPGFGEALRLGFREARGGRILTLDADLSHDPDFIPKLWRARDRAEILIASRYVRGGVAYMPLHRKVLSKLLNRVFAGVLSLPVRDVSSGFRLYEARAVRALDLEGRHFEILEEVAVKALAQGWRVEEIPFTYFPRERGSSHARIVVFGARLALALAKLWRLRSSIESADYDERAFHSWIWPQRWWQRRRHRIITELARSEGRVLDVGCGSSVILRSLNDAVGLDVSLPKLRFMRSSATPLIQGSVFALPIRDGAFDCVICSEVIEHIEEDPVIFHELRRVLRTGGKLILGTPDYATITWRVIEPIYGVVVPGGYKHEHITHYTRESLRRIARENGFQVESEQYVGGAELILGMTKLEAGPARIAPGDVTPAPLTRAASATAS